LLKTQCSFMTMRYHKQMNCPAYTGHALRNPSLLSMDIFKADGGLQQLFNTSRTRNGGEICMQPAILCCTIIHLTLFWLLAARSTFYLIRGQLNLTSRCQSLCKHSFLAKAMTPNMVKSCHLLACYHNMMLWPYS